METGRLAARRGEGGEAPAARGVVDAATAEGAAVGARGVAWRAPLR